MIGLRVFSTIFSIVFPVLAISLVGFLWAKAKLPFDTNTVGQLVMNIGAPCLIISSLSKTQLNIEVFWQMTVLTLSIVSAFLLFGFAILKFWKKPLRTFLPSLVFVNTGNLGLPLCLFAFGEQGLAYGIAFFMIMSVLHFSLGLAMVSGEGVFSTLIRNPIVHSVWVAITLLVNGWDLPVSIANTINLLGQFAIPLMLFALGVSLASLKVKDLPLALGFSLIRVVGGAAVAWGICELFDIDGVMRGVLILQAAMPVAVFNYLISERYQQQPQVVASLVVVSTLVSFILLPVLFWILL